MVLKRKKDLRNICKTLVRPGLVISGSVREGEGRRGGVDVGEPSVPLSTTMSVSSLSIPSMKNLATAGGTTDVGVQIEFRNIFSFMNRVALCSLLIMI